MPAININYFVPVEGPVIPLFANDSSQFANPIEASLTPVGTRMVNDGTKWYVNVDPASLEFRIFVPEGYTLDDIYSYDQPNDEWQQENWRQVRYGESYTRELCYYTDDDLPSRYIEGYKAYVFAEKNIFGESVKRKFPLSFNIIKNK